MTDTAELLCSRNTKIYFNLSVLDKLSLNEH